MHKIRWTDDKEPTIQAHSYWRGYKKYSCLEFGYFSCVNTSQNISAGITHKYFQCNMVQWRWKQFCFLLQLVFN